MYFAYENKKDAYQIRQGTALSPIPHVHSHIEIILMEGGCSVATADFTDVTVEKGDLFIAFPNQVHYYIDKKRPATHTILIISPDMLPEFSRIFKTMIPKTPLLKNAMDNSRISTATQGLLECSGASDEYVETEVRGNMLILLSELFRNMEFTEKASLDHDIVKDIIAYCYENYSSDISLQLIADNLHISRCYISRIFSRRLHIGFNDYINSLRIRSACEMLKTGEMTVTEIAYAAGYNSVRTFDRCFMNVKGMTPKEYRLKALKKKENK